MKKSLFLIVISVCLSYYSFSQVSQLFMFGQYKPGYYFDSTGNKVSGMLKFTYGAKSFENKKYGVCELLFKEERGDKRQKFKSNEVRSFVIDGDSFAVVKNVSVPQVNCPQDFARVVMTGRVNLYQYYALINNGRTVHQRRYYIVQKDGRFYSGNHHTMKAVIQTVYFSDYPELEGEMNKKRISHDDLPVLTQKYNEHFQDKAAS